MLDGLHFLPGFLVLKDILQRDSKSSSDLEGEIDRGHVFSLFKRDNGLSGAADFVSQFLLRHFIVVETQSSDTVFYPNSIRHVLPLSSNLRGYLRSR